MEKIVILTERSESDSYLLSLLNTLFPDCEIKIVYKKGNTLRNPHANTINLFDKETDTPYVV